jgi:hypothetical protein
MTYVRWRISEYVHRLIVGFKKGYYNGIKDTLYKTVTKFDIHVI